MRYISGTKLDERIIRCDLDLGYREGRQFGRGKSGGQVRSQKTCFFHALNDTLWRFEMSIDKIMTPAEEDGVPRRRESKLKGGARLKNGMQTWSRAPPWQSVVEIGSKHWHLLRNQLLSVPGHPTMKTTALDNALGWMKILDGCNFFGTLCLYSIVMSCCVQSYVCELSCEICLQIENEGRWSTHD
jgi:hypothetical protein